MRVRVGGVGLEEEEDAHGLCSLVQIGVSRELLVGRPHP